MIIIFKLALIGLVTLVNGQDDGFTDENRPYKFGFNIEGYQHRYEEKNEKGIIMGEYGFITADGVYHLTVYATDDNGNFKILKMKNIKIGLPMEKATTPIPGVSGERLQRIKEVTSKPVVKLNGKPACGGCLVPTPPPPIKEMQKNQPIRGENEIIKKNPLAEVFDPEKVKIKGATEKLDSPRTSNTVNPTIPPLLHTLGPAQKSLHPNIQNSVNPDPVKSMDMKNTNKYSNPNTVTNQIKPKVEEKQELLKNVMDLMNTLYKFNYTLTYHGHEETGNGAGEKNGSYFVNGRDGFQRKVSYTANEFGYQPNISLVKIGPEETPKEDTERELTKLLGNEFIWYYQ